MGFFINSILFFILSITSFHQSVVHLPIVAAKDVLVPGDELNSLDFSSTLISANGVFTLGFFEIPPTNFTYLAIWNTNAKQDIKFWVANRDKPFIGQGILRIDDSPTLKVVNPSGTTLFNISNDHQFGSSNIASAILQDSGNFIVYDKGNRTLWQSFDHPTYTLVSGMKLGYNLTTKQNWTLTSPLSDQVPSSGAFTMRLEQYQNIPLYWDEVGERQLTGPEMVQQAKDKIEVIRRNLKAAQDRQKSWADVRRRPLEFEVGDRVYLRAAPMKGVKRFGVKGKLSPRYVRPFDIVERIGKLAYRLRLPESMSRVHNVFHVSMLKKCLSQVEVGSEIDPGVLQDNLAYEEKPIKILDRKEKLIKRRVVPLVLVQWSNHAPTEATWEVEADMFSEFPEFSLLPDSSGRKESGNRGGATGTNNS